MESQLDCGEPKVSPLIRETPPVLLVCNSVAKVIIPTVKQLTGRTGSSNLEHLAYDATGRGC